MTVVCQDERRLRRPRGLAEGVAAAECLQEKRRRSAWLRDRVHRRSPWCRSRPWRAAGRTSVGGAADGAGAERMQVIRKRAGHELDLRQRERAVHVAVIPAGVNGDLAHRENWRETSRRCRPSSISKPNCRHTSRAVENPVVAKVIASFVCPVCARRNRRGPTSRRVRRPAPCPPGRWRFPPTARRAARRAGCRWSGSKRRCSSRCKTVAHRPGEQHLIFNHRQPGQLRIHGGLVAPHFRPDGRVRRVRAG